MWKSTGDPSVTVVSVLSAPPIVNFPIALGNATDAGRGVVRIPAWSRLKQRWRADSASG